MQLDVTWLYDDLEGNNTAAKALEMGKKEDKEHTQSNWLNNIHIPGYAVANADSVDH